jgi:DNA-binding CsgD family transcriptional regulator
MGARTDADTRVRATQFVVRGSRGETTATRTAIGAIRQARSLATDAGAAALAFAVIMFAGTFALRMAVHASDAAGLFLLFVIPIAALTLAYGSRAGALAATLALGLVYLRGSLQQTDIDVAGYATRAITFYAIPFVTWLAKPDGAPKTKHQPRASARPPVKDLTRRELEVLGLIAEGRTNAEIADELVLSVRTIESHRASMQRKLGRPSRAELQLHALERGLLSGDSLTGVPNSGLSDGRSRY